MLMGSSGSNVDSRNEDKVWLSQEWMIASITYTRWQDFNKNDIYGKMQSLTTAPTPSSSRHDLDKSNKRSPLASYRFKYKSKLFDYWQLHTIFLPACFGFTHSHTLVCTVDKYTNGRMEMESSKWLVRGNAQFNWIKSNRQLVIVFIFSQFYFLLSVYSCFFQSRADQELSFLWIGLDAFLVPSSIPSCLSTMKDCKSLKECVRWMNTKNLM